MAAWQSGTHGEAAGTLACTGPSIASSALRFAGRTGTLTMTSGSPTSVMAPGSQLTPLARGQEEKNHLLRPASTELLMPLNNDLGTAAKTTSAMVMGRLRLKAFTRRYRWPLSNNRGESHNSTTFHTKSATVVKSISHYL